MPTRLNALAHELLPPLALRGLAALKRRIVGRATAGQGAALYWNEEFAEALETWGADSAWPEIELLLAGRAGRVLDIACGTGAVMARLRRFPRLDLYGIDFSDILIERANQKGFGGGHALVADATRLPYADGTFEFAYSIGSLEHFKEPDIERFLAECARVATQTSFHHIPVSRSERDEGWITPYQAYYNNSMDWWLARFQRAFPAVAVIASSWSDPRSAGRWFLCTHDGPAAGSAP